MGRPTRIYTFNRCVRHGILNVVVNIESSQQAVWVNKRHKQGAKKGHQKRPVTYTCVNTDIDRSFRGLLGLNGSCVPRCTTCKIEETFFFDYSHAGVMELVFRSPKSSISYILRTCCRKNSCRRTYCHSSRVTPPARQAYYFRCRERCLWWWCNRDAARTWAYLSMWA